MAACQYSWIDQVVQGYSKEIFPTPLTHFVARCTTDGICTTNPNTLPLPPSIGTDAAIPPPPSNYTEYLTCAIGNSKYACEMDHITPGITPPCAFEGTLNSTRSLACCPTQLPFFLKGMSIQPPQATAGSHCLPGFGSMNQAVVCCTDSTDPASCRFNDLCLDIPGITSYRCQSSLTLAICYGSSNMTTDVPSKEAGCIQEVTLGKQVDPNCHAMVLPKDGNDPAVCALGGAGPSPSTTAGPGPGATDRPLNAAPELYRPRLSKVSMVFLAALPALVLQSLAL